MTQSVRREPQLARAAGLWDHGHVKRHVLPGCAFAILIAVLGGDAVAETRMQSINYCGWENSIELRNDVARVVVVPAVGRIMHYGFVGGDNLLFVDRNHVGRVNTNQGPATADGEPCWINYGGDRVWPTEEDRFEEVNGARRPPDHFFDGMPWHGRMDGNEVVLESEVSDFCGARVVRRVSLAPDSARVTIRQRLLKVRLGRRTDLEPIPLTIWNVSTIRLPEQIFFPLNPESCHAGLVLVPAWPDQPNQGAENVTRDNGIGVFLPKNVDQKVGADAPGWIAGIVDDIMMVERFQFDPKAVYPDGGTSVTAYLNPSIGELECLSPLVELKPGESLGHTVVWELSRIGAGNLEERRREALQRIQELSALPAR